jgi:hypothetical protein
MGGAVRPHSRGADSSTRIRAQRWCESGGFQAGAVPRLAVTPHVGVSWRKESGFLFVVHDLSVEERLTRRFTLLFKA